MNEASQTSVLFIRAVPESLKKDFKAWCAQQGKSMTDVIVTFMQEKVDGRGNAISRSS